jgi:hypothetical protein
MIVAPVSQIAPVREVSTLIGAAIGGRLFAEQHLRSRLVTAFIIILGVVAIAQIIPGKFASPQCLGLN